MRLPIIISYAVFAVCFGLFGCSTNAKDSSNDDKNDNQQLELSDNQHDSTNYLLIVTDSEIFKSQYSTKSVTTSEFEIENHRKDFDNFRLVRHFTSTCIDNIYILKCNGIHDMIQELDVIRYNKNGTFERVNQIKGMFDHARSLTSDYKTGKIYWIDHDHSGEYSIKVTDESFEKSEYVIHPSNQFMRNLRADPKRRKIFFSSIEHFWYASNSPNSTANLLFSSEVSFQFIIDFTIDYITDKLCWIERLNNDFYLYCVVIGTLDRPLNTTDIVTIEKFPTYIKTLLAFNNTYYWTTSDNYGYNLYFKNGNEAAVKKAEYFTFVHYSIVPSVCPPAQKNGAKNNKVPHSSTEIDTPKQNDNQQTALSDDQNVLLLVTDSKIFTSQDFADNVSLSLSEYQIEDYSTLPKSFEYTNDFTSTCSDDNIYILKYNNYKKIYDMKQMLEVIRYDKSGKFERTNQIKDMFDNATSITSDYKTGKIYWVKYTHNDDKFSIKVTDESFEKSEYIINPTSEIAMKKIQAYPNHNELFFSSHHSLWYTSNSPNSTVKLLFPPKITFQKIWDFTIDYITDKLCWVDYFDGQSHLYFASIGTFERPLGQFDIIHIATIPEYIDNLVAFNNTFYWIVFKDNKQKLYFKNGNEPAVEKADLPENGLLSIVPPICPPPAEGFLESDEID